MVSFSISARATLLALLAPLVVAQTSPIKVIASEWIDQEQASTNDPRILRDGGAQGQIGPYFVQSYADTSYCPTEADFETASNCVPAAPNCIAANSFVANEVIDFAQPYPTTFCTTDGSDTTNARLHIQNIVPTGQDTGVVWYIALGACPAGASNADGCPVGNGVATVNYNNGNPTCQATPTFWDPNTEPLWGPAVGPRPDGYIYLQGQLNYPAPRYTDNYVYIARVPATSATDYSTYEYWNGTEFTSSRLHYPNFGGFSPAAVIGGDQGMGSFTYSNYYDQYLMLAIDNSTRAVVGFTSENPQGPYAKGTIYSNASMQGIVGFYDPVALTSYDTSGKNLTFAVSEFGRNSVGAVVRVTFA